ncbi:MAG: outer membrane protein assembly factor BamA [Rickettsiales bacterium]|nr:outer membrane protein assembly factor BamA [Rickettsiales bacterium]
MAHRTIFLTVITLCILAISGLAGAVAAAPGVVVKGNQRIETDTIISFLALPDKNISEDDINRALSNLYQTGLFSDVFINRDGNTLTVRVVENPIISEVAFEGNKRIDDETLLSEVRLKPRTVYRKTDLQADLRRLLDVYNKSGRFSVDIEPKVIQLSDNRVNLVYEIDEGDRTEIRHIHFVGNEAFSDDRLKSILQTKETRWYRFFSSDDTYDADRINFDKELLRRYYAARGYADFRVLSVIAELTPEKNAFYLTYSLEEGPVYTFGDMRVESHLRDVDTETLLRLVKTKTGEVFNADKIESTIEALTKALGNQGYAFVKIDPQFHKDAAGQVIGITYVIEEGPRVYVEEINIKGNVRTLDEVVRREFRLEEGDPYNADQLRRSRQRINNLDFFQKVDIATRQGSAPDRVIIDVDVEEKSTGELTFGAGFSTSDGALGDISLTERNLLGKGQFLKLNLTISTIRQEIDLSFTEPYFMGKNVAVGFDVFSTKQNNNSSLSRRSYDLESIGGGVHASYPLTEHLTHTVSYSLRSDDITDVDSTASLFVRKQAGKSATSMVGHNLIYDKRDSSVDPTSGHYLRLNQDVAGLGGDVNFFRNEILGSYYYPVFSKDWVLRLSGRGGHILGLNGDDVPINHRFFVGGRYVRGFNSDGIGPRDESTRDPLGGNTYATATAEMTFPLGLPEELGFKGAIFADAGTLFDVDEVDSIDPNTGTLSRVLDESSIRTSVGMGVAWASPLGPIRIDFAHAINKESFDETEVIRFSFGTRF